MMDDGFFDLWIDDVLVETISDLDNDELAIEAVRLGAADCIDSSTSGTVYLDSAIEKLLHVSTRGDDHIGLDIDERLY